MNQFFSSVEMGLTINLKRHQSSRVSKRQDTCCTGVNLESLMLVTLDTN